MTREPIYAALFARAWDSAFQNPKDEARTLKHWSDVPPEQMPALFFTQGRETVAKTAVNGLPVGWQADVSLYVYVKRTDDLSAGAVLNPILDTIEAKFASTPDGRPQRLGGLVQWARIEGSIQTSEGTLGDLEVAIVPLRFLAY